jgi:hypothetical protein
MSVPGNATAGAPQRATRGGGGREAKRPGQQRGVPTAIWRRRIGVLPGAVAKNGPSSPWDIPYASLPLTFCKTRSTIALFGAPDFAQQRRERTTAQFVSRLQQLGYTVILELEEKPAA